MFCYIYRKLYNHFVRLKGILYDWRNSRWHNRLCGRKEDLTPPCAEKLSHFISPAISCINSIHITFVLRLGGIFMIISYYLHIIFTNFSYFINEENNTFMHEKNYLETYWVQMGAKLNWRKAIAGLKLIINKETTCLFWYILDQILKRR